MSNASRERVPAGSADAASRAARKARVTITLRYVSIGAVLGVVWMISSGSGESLVMHVVRSVIIAVVALVLLQLPQLLRNRPKKPEERAGAMPMLSLVLLIGFKLALLLLAAVAELALEYANVADPTPIVAPRSE